MRALSRWFANLGFRFRAILNPYSMERQLEEEMAFHLEMETEKLISRGLSPSDARREAQVRFGSLGRSKQQARDSWGIGLVTDLKADVRLALRQMNRRPAFAAGTILTLALGIGTTVALWSVAHGVLLRPLPYADEQRLVTFWTEGDWFGIEVDLVKSTATTFDALAAFAPDSETLQAGDTTVLVPLVRAGAGIFDVLGVGAQLGRTFEPADDLPGAPPVVVVSHGLWQQELGADPDVIGSQVLIGGEQTTVVGVMPAGFYFPDADLRAWKPLRLHPSNEDYANNGYLGLVGRLKDDATPARIASDLTIVCRALRELMDYPPAWDKTKAPRLIPIRERLVGDARPAVLLLLSTVALLFLIACANVAALLLTRTLDREQELAVRASLGASRTRLARQLVTEAVVLGMTAAVLGAGLAHAVFGLLVRQLPLPAGLHLTLALDWTGLLVALVLAIAAGGLVALAPVRDILKGKLENAMGGVRTGSGAGSSSRAHDSLVVGEVVLAVALVLAATLLIRSVDNLFAIDPGFDPESTLSVDLVTSPGSMSDGDRWAFFDQVADRAGALPGVRAVGFTNRLPIRDGGAQGPLRPADQPEIDGPNAFYRIATPDYFEAMGISLLHGRVFDRSDRRDAAQVAVVTENLAHRLWPGQEPLGKLLTSGNEGFQKTVEVVGVVEDLQLRGVADESPLVLFRPHPQRAWLSRSNTLVIRSRLDPLSLTASVRALVHELDERVAVARVTTLQEVVSGSLAIPIRIRFFLLVFAGLGLALGAVGVYGVIADRVARGRAELGVRTALGATPVDLLGQVLWRGVVLVALGTVGGLTVAVLGAQLLRSFLFGVAPTDPVSFAIAAAVLMLTGVVASLIPAVRAGFVDPIEALRSD